MNPNKVRVAVGALSFSAAALIGLVTHEGYVDKAMIPTKGDRPTVGFGSTFNANGAPVKLGDTTTPVRALITVQTHLAKQEYAFRKSLTGVSLSQAEYDVYMDWAYQYGMANWQGSSMLRLLLAGEYSQACDALLLWKMAGGFDCSTPGNKQCPGVWTRQLERHKACKAAQ